MRGARPTLQAGERPDDKQWDGQNPRLRPGEGCLAIPNALRSTGMRGSVLAALSGAIIAVGAGGLYLYLRRAPRAGLGRIVYRNDARADDRCFLTSGFGRSQANLGVCLPAEKRAVGAPNRARSATTCRDTFVTIPFIRVGNEGTTHFRQPALGPAVRTIAEADAPRMI